MAWPTGRPFMTNNEKKKRASEEAKLKELEKDEQEAARAHEVEKKREAMLQPLILKLRLSKTGGHHCALNDSGRKHHTSPACLTKKHMGGCRECNDLVSARDGCKECGVKAADLEYDNVMFPPGFKQPKLAPQQDCYTTLLPWSQKKKDKKTGPDKTKKDVMEDARGKYDEPDGLID